MFLTGEVFDNPFDVHVVVRVCENNILVLVLLECLGDDLKRALVFADAFFFSF